VIASRARTTLPALKSGAPVAAKIQTKETNMETREQKTLKAPNTTQYPKETDKAGVPAAKEAAKNLPPASPLTQSGGKATLKP